MFYSNERHSQDLESGVYSALTLSKGIRYIL